MLVLSRKKGERIYIGEGISITVVDIDRGKVRLGIEAPRDIPIWREEILPAVGLHVPASADPGFIRLQDDHPISDAKEVTP